MGHWLREWVRVDGVVLVEIGVGGVEIWHCVFGRALDVVFGFFFQAEDGIRDVAVTGVQTCALPISWAPRLLPIWGSAGRYMSMANGPMAESRPRISTRRSVWESGEAGEEEGIDAEIGRASCRERV